MRVLELARLAAAFPLIGSVKRTGDKSVFRQFLRIQSGCLLRHAASGMGNDDRRIFLAFLKSVWEIDDRGNGDVPPIVVEKSYVFIV